ncbi:hypothetical protein POM88_018289 [Heracleum sosnowskyi]|uniref:SWIM-type domain-containing protein n=1 Tax=Heracleum sosnowskyi TaxID=360622 RepID=A0AAD8IR36_9APIA|nr:hypothetical protein POM88_018289 [Heracleum sosnowskyi]
MRAFINGCRNVVGLDGCHLKGKYGGCVLSVTALDGQNGFVHLGIMVCKNERAENWFLFLKHLKPRLDEHLVHAINFIFDRQKGLRGVVHTIFPTSLHSMFWNAARAYKAKHFQAHMDSMMVENVKAFEYLMSEDPKSWEKPLCTLILMYGQLVMGLFYKRRNVCAGRVSGDLVPSAKKLMKLMFKKIGEYKVAGAVAGKVYEVTRIHSSIFTVDLDRKTCRCVQWQLRGFPCQHAVCVLQQVRPNWVQYCGRYYSVDNYKITYALCMVPLEGPDD